MATAGYDCWLFDLDGTIVDVERSYLDRVLGDVATALDCSFTSDERLALWYGTDGVRRATLHRHGIAVETFWRTFERVRDPHERVAATRLYDDATGVGDLDDPVGIVTHCPAAITDEVLDAVDIADWFDTVVCCDDDLGWKPDPDPVRHALTDLGVAPDALTNGTDGVLVGDAPCDVGAAWNTGLDAVHVERHDPTVRGRCVRADRRVTSVGDVVR